MCKSTQEKFSTLRELPQESTHKLYVCVCLQYTFQRKNNKRNTSLSLTSLVILLTLTGSFATWEMKVKVRSSFTTREWYNVCCTKNTEREGSGKKQTRVNKSSWDFAYITRMRDYLLEVIYFSLFLSWGKAVDCTSCMF